MGVAIRLRTHNDTRIGECGPLEPEENPRCREHRGAIDRGCPASLSPLPMVQYHPLLDPRVRFRRRRTTNPADDRCRFIGDFPVFTGDCGRVAMDSFIAS